LLARSTSAAPAERLFVSQLALSQQIRSLEAEVGFKLFERNRRGVQLTPEGAAFLSEAEAVVQQADRAPEVARALAEGGAGHLRLSQLRTMPRGLPERVTAEFHRRRPGAEIIPESGSTEQNVDRLRTAQLDFAFVLAPLEDTPGIGCLELAPEPVVVALPTGHPLSRRRRIRREELADLPLVFHPRHNSPGFYDSLLSQVYGTVTPNIVRTERNEERMLGVTISLGPPREIVKCCGSVRDGLAATAGSWRMNVLWRARDRSSRLFTRPWFIAPCSPPRPAGARCRRIYGQHLP
jgi:DNA-binding transcriptional LysR family regulator